MSDSIYPSNHMEVRVRFFTEGPHVDVPRYEVQVDPTGISMGKQYGKPDEFLFDWDQLYNAMEEYAENHPEIPYLTDPSATNRVILQDIEKQVSH